MSTKGRRSHTTNEQNVARFPATRHFRVVKDELAADAQPLVGGAMALARDECSDDRPPLAEAPGIRLRESREALALTIEDLARTTKISKTILTAIETGDVRRLPAVIYTRGFVKAYAREVGLEPDSTAEEYVAAIARLRVDTPLDDAGHPATVARPAPAPVPFTRHAGVDNSMGQFGWVTTMVAVVGLIAYLGYLGSFDGEAPGDPRDAILTPAASDAAKATQQAQPTSEADATKAGAGPLRLELRTQGLCWLVLTVDGVPVVTRLLQPGEQHIFEVDEEAVMRIGDPGALTLYINGQAARRLGERGEPVDVRITTSNFHQFLGI